MLLIRLESLESQQIEAEADAIMPGVQEINPQMLGGDEEDRTSCTVMIGLSATDSGTLAEFSTTKREIIVLGTGDPFVETFNVDLASSTVINTIISSTDFSATVIGLIESSTYLVPHNHYEHGLLGYDDHREGSYFPSPTKYAPAAYMVLGDPAQLSDPSDIYARNSSPYGADMDGSQNYLGGNLNVQKGVTIHGAYNSNIALHVAISTVAVYDPEWAGEIASIHTNGGILAKKKSIFTSGTCLVELASATYDVNAIGAGLINSATAFCVGGVQGATEATGEKFRLPRAGGGWKDFYVRGGLLTET